jgi:hypothetical protein
MWTKEYPLDGINVPSLKKETHQYFCGDGHEYMSVSSILSRIKPKFDVDIKATECANRAGVTVESILKKWEDKKNAGLNYGTDIHENVESYFINGEILNKRYEEVIHDIYEKVYKKGGYNELICFDKEKLICGTADYVVFRDDGFFDIYDFKTNIKFNFENKFDDKFLLDPVSHLPNSEYFIYALQLSLYANMIEKLTNSKCGFLRIFWLKRQLDTKNIFKAKWFKYNVPYLKEEVEDILCLV